MTERPMRRKDRQLSQEEALALLEKGTHGVLSLVGDDGWPYAIPINYIWMEGKLYLHGAKAGYKLDCIARDPRVCFTVVTRADVIEAHITTLYESVVVMGTAEVVPPSTEHRAALHGIVEQLCAVTPEIKAQYIDKKEKNTAIVAITPLQITAKASRSYLPVTERL